MKWTFFLVLLWLATALPGQDSLSVNISPPEPSIADTIKHRIKEKSPIKAAIYSLVLPGAGQVYNGKAWKVPIVYAALGTSYYFIRTNKAQYHRFRDAYLIRIDDDPNTSDEFVDLIPTAEGIKSYRDQARRYMEISYFSFGFVWLLNSIEAYVDCHLLQFDISEDLSLAIGKYNPGISIQINLGRHK